MEINFVFFIFLFKIIKCSIVDINIMRVGIKMRYLRCNNCNSIINNKMDSYYFGNIEDFFCLYDCIVEYCIREMEI